MHLGIGDTGPALLYPDGFGIWAIHGVRVPQRVIEAPTTITAQEVAAEQNVAVRRVMIERMGTARYLREAGAVKVNTDDWGTLWSLDSPGDERIVMVEVLNSTPEADGSFSTYWLRVPPATRTAHAAVAWTFGESVETYAPVIQT